MKFFINILVLKLECDIITVNLGGYIKCIRNP